eukprot:1284955-Pleurochrysis_carterae.AAC.2
MKTQKTLGLIGTGNAADSVKGLLADATPDSVTKSVTKSADGEEAVAAADMLGAVRFEWRCFGKMLSIGLRCAEMLSKASDGGTREDQSDGVQARGIVCVEVLNTVEWARSDGASACAGGGERALKRLECAKRDRGRSRRGKSARGRVEASNGVWLVDASLALTHTQTLTRSGMAARARQHAQIKLIDPPILSAAHTCSHRLTR